MARRRELSGAFARGVHGATAGRGAITVVKVGAGIQERSSASKFLGVVPQLFRLPAEVARASDTLAAAVDDSPAK